MVMVVVVIVIVIVLVEEQNADYVQCESDATNDQDQHWVLDLLQRHKPLDRLEKYADAER